MQANPAAKRCSMRFHPELEAAFLASRSAALGASDIGIAALSCCLWLVQLLSFALARQQRMAGKSASGAEPAAAADATPAPSIEPSCDDASGMQSAANQEGTCPSLAAQLMAAGDVCLPGESSGGRVDVEREFWQVAASSWHEGGAAVSGLLTESKLFALAHAGLAFRFCRWQHTAALQTLLVALLASHTAWQDPCSQPELLVGHAHQRPTLRQAADTLTNMHWLPLQLLADPGSECNDSSSSSRGSVVHAAGGAKEAQLPFLCLGWVLPVWVAALSEAGARARFASQHVAHLHPCEKEWAVRAAVGYEWLSLVYQLPCMCLITWHLLVAAAVVARWQSGAGGAGS
ncbi:hypothetical protein D9Q98_008123 [Chlorella vulgaris]|uniref:Uncharacterized protein n=1 Tax=Chlorella vulgaris TaxID=3077 RepID=A0A9D4YT38_CHLVU|nr:hypothetical protein D9Q98_008123 [Chlorella vulgaris]